MSLAYDPAEGRSPWTKWWGVAALVGLPIGYGIVFAPSESYLPVGVIMLVIGFIGYLMTLRSAYTNSQKRKLKAALDEREQHIMAQAYNYSFRALAMAVLLFLIYAVIASQPERANLWFPHSRNDWTSFIFPLALLLPLLPTIFAEWLDPAHAAVDGDD